MNVPEEAVGVTFGSELEIGVVDEDEVGDDTAEEARNEEVTEVGVCAEVLDEGIEVEAGVDAAGGGDGGGGGGGCGDGVIEGTVETPALCDEERFGGGPVGTVRLVGTGADCPRL